MFSLRLASIVVSGFLLLAACATKKAPDVSGNVKNSLEQAGLKDVSVDQDRDKGVVTLKGNVDSDADKARADSIAKSTAGDQVVANEIAVLPKGSEQTAKDVNSDLDAGIKKNLDAALLQNSLKDNVKYDVKNGVVTLTGKVNSPAKRATTEKIAAAVPNVQQVVNELEVKNQRATSTRNSY